MDSFDRFCAAQLARLDRKWDRAIVRIAGAADPCIRQQIKEQGEINQTTTLLDEQSSLQVCYRGTAGGKRKPRLDQMDGSRQD